MESDWEILLAEIRDKEEPFQFEWHLGSSGAKGLFKVLAAINDYRLACGKRPFEFIPLETLSLPGQPPLVILAVSPVIPEDQS
ncbi:MAG: hypothetical protein KW788_04165 [Candidatus Doudnabacteria bacterium]|nr:hypothetical protein [Candidatus Doudnabacteria bacterium]